MADEQNLELENNGNGLEGDGAEVKDNEEQKLDYEKLYKDAQAENARYKKALDKATGEASSFKKQLKSKMTEDEQLAELQAEKDKKLAIYEKSENLQKVYQGMSADTAKNIATLEANGDFDGVHEAMNEYIENLIKQRNTDALMNRKRVNAGSGTEQVTKEQFASMSLAEKSKLYTENKAEYDRLKNLK